MIVYQLPNGHLLIPRAVETDELIGDGLDEVAPGDEDYQRYMDWFRRSGERPVPIKPQSNTPDAETLIEAALAIHAQVQDPEEAARAVALLAGEATNEQV